MQRYIETNRSRVHVSITVDRFLLRCTLDTPYFGESKGSFKCITLSAYLKIDMYIEIRL